MSALLRRHGGLLLVALFCGCGDMHVVRVPVSAMLDERDEPPKSLVTGVRVAVARPVLANEPERTVELTSAAGESYPSMSHLVVTVPQALRELGFDVVEVAAPEEAQALNADLLLQLDKPDVTSFHPAQEGRVTLVGSAYDVRVRYKGRLGSPDGRSLGIVQGYGQDTSRFTFMEPLFKAAIVGVFVSIGTLVASGFMMLVVFQFGVLSNLAQGGEPFGLCAPDGAMLKSMPQRLPDRENICGRIVNYAMYTAFVLGVSTTTALAGSLAGALGENVFDVFLSIGHLSMVDPTWKRMVKRAHDGAARDLAERVAEAAAARSALRRLPPPATPLPATPPPATPPPAVVPQPEDATPAPPPPTPAPAPTVDPLLPGEEPAPAPGVPSSDRAPGVPPPQPILP